MDLETKQLLDQVKQALAGQDELKGAVEQLEAQVKNVPTTIDQKVKQARLASWDRNGRYRGVLGSEEQARSFGLFVLSRGAGRDWAAEALKSEFPDVVKEFGTTEAGNLLPEEYTGRIVDLIEQHGVIERNALRVPMSADTQKYSKKTARMSAAPMDEATALDKTKPTLANRSLVARKWGAYVEVPSEVSDDAVAAIGEMIARDMAQSFALAVDEAGLVGDGSGTYNSITGIIDSLIAQAIVTGADTTWADLTLANFQEVVSRVTTRTFVNNEAVWIVSPQFFWTVIAKHILASGGVTAAEIEGRRSLQFLGFRVEFSTVMPTSTAVGEICAIFGSIRQGVTFGDRRQLTVKQSEHYKFAEDVLAFLGTRRFDLNVDGAGTGTTVEVLAALKTADT